MSIDQIDHLYSIYDILNEATDKTKHESEYMEIINAAHGSEKEKKLAAQFIPKFFKHFPSLNELAIDSQLDLCEEDDILIRRLAIKELPTFCRDTQENTPRISDILAQLLKASDTTELQQVNISLKLLSKLDSIGTITGLFHQIKQGDENVRLKCLEFINNHLVKADPEVDTKKTEEFIINEVKVLLKDVSGEEFQQCVQILSQTKMGKTITGHQELVKICLEQVDLDADFDDSADDIVYIYLTCVNQALQFFSTQIETTPFVKYTCEKLFPNWHLIGVTEDQTQIQLRILKAFAELCTNCGTLEKPNESIEAIFNVLIKEYLPAPPPDLEEIQSSSILFSHVECLLYAIHTIGKQCPDFEGFKKDSDKLKDFRARLQYLARRTQGYIKKLQEDVKEKNTTDPKTDEEKIKEMGLKTTSNIQILIRDLYHPIFKSKIRLSWLNEKPKSKIVAVQVAEKTSSSTSLKRPITFSSESNSDQGVRKAKQVRGNNQQMYSPPSGKFSSRIASGPQQHNNSNRFKGNPKNRFRRGGARNQRY